MSTCETCRFMAAPRDDDFPRASGPMNGTAWVGGTCTRIIHANGSWEPPSDADPALWGPNQPAVVLDGSGYAARLVVLPTFGCNLWEEP